MEDDGIIKDRLWIDGMSDKELRGVAIDLISIIDHDLHRKALNSEMDDEIYEIVEFLK